MKKESKITLIILSALSLLNVMFVPVFDVWGGLVPDDIDRNFFDVIKMIFSDSDCWRYWVVSITISILIPSIFMLITSLLGKKVLCIVSSAAGIVFWLKQIISFGAEDDGFENMFDFDDGSISIGTWIAIILFIASLIVASFSKKEVKTSFNGNLNYSAANAFYTNAPAVPNGQTNYQVTPASPVSAAGSKYCPQCGKALAQEAVFCGSCGCKISK